MAENFDGMPPLVPFSSKPSSNNMSKIKKRAPKQQQKKLFFNLTADEIYNTGKKLKEIRESQPSTSKQSTLPPFNFDNLNAQSPMYKKKYDIVEVHKPTAKSFLSDFCNDLEIFQESSTENMDSSNYTTPDFIQNENPHNFETQYGTPPNVEVISDILVSDPKFHYDMSNQNEILVDASDNALQFQDPIEETPSVFENILNTLSCRINEPKQQTLMYEIQNPSISEQLVVPIVAQPKAKKKNHLCMAEFQNLSIDEKLNQLYKESSWFFI